MNYHLQISQRLYLVVIYAIFLTSVHAQTFPCDGSLLFMVNRDTINNTINKVNFGPFGLITYNPVAFVPQGKFNALGFNPLDNYLYGVMEGTNKIIRLKSDGSYDWVGEIPDVDDAHIIAGDCTPEGYFMVYIQNLQQIMIFDVVDQFALRKQVDLSWDTGIPFATRIHDLAIDPTQPQIAYAVQGNYDSVETQPAESRGFLLQINLDSSPGEVTPVGKISDPSIKKMGSLIFTSDGQLYGYGSDASGPNYPQKSFMSIDKWSGLVNQSIFRGPTAATTDGCSCPYNLSFYNNVQPREITCSNTMLTFKFQIINRFFVPLDGLSIRDTIPEGMKIENIIGDFDGRFAPISEWNERIIEISEIFVPPRSTLEIDVQVRLVDGPAGVMKVQASLMNLPERLGGTIPSDDPFSPGAVDDTDFMIFPESLSSYKLEVNHPTDCLHSEDASIRLSSPQFSPGQSYEVKLLNQQWEVDTIEVIVDSQNAFRIDSVEAGKYELFELTSQSIRCPQELRDTIIEVNAPHEDLITSIDTNAPVCEQMDLHFQVQAPAESTLIWRGPERFGSEDMAPIIREVTASHAGTYTLATTYGYCERKDTLLIDVKPNVQARIVGDSLYCERDDIQLTVQDQGENMSYRWINPNGYFVDSRNITIASATPDVGGLYTLLVNNGACIDTARSVVVVAPSPVLSLPALVETNNCEPLYLYPELLSDLPVSYHWTSTDKLSCLDCEHPEVILPFDPVYELVVTNTFGCQDSARVQVTLSHDETMYLPNVISRNRSGTNQNFQIFPSCAVTQVNKVEIYDRWGSIVFATGPTPSLDTPIVWDGLADRQRIHSGVYTYMVEVILADNSVARYGGTLTVLD